MIRKLHVLAAFGAGLHLVGGLIRSFPFQKLQFWALALFSLMVFASALVVALFVRQGFRQLCSNPELLVPVGLYSLAKEILIWLLALPLVGPALKWSAPVHVSGMSFGLGISLILQLALSAILAGWLASLSLQVLRGQSLQLIQPWRDLKRWIWRMLGVQLIGWLAVVAYISTGLAVLLALFKLGFVGGIIATVVLLAASLALNLAGLFLIAAQFGSGRGFLHAVKDGVGLGLRHVRRLILPVLAFSVLVGSIPRVTFSLSRGNQSFNIQFNIVWLGN